MYQVDAIFTFQCMMQKPNKIALVVKIMLSTKMVYLVLKLCLISLGD